MMREAEGEIGNSGLGVAVFTVFEAKKRNLRSDQGGQTCTGANS